MDADLESHSSYKIGQGILKTLPLIFVILGTVGNVMSIAVLTRKQMRKSTTSIFLTVLAISDLCVLYTGFIYGWFQITFQYDITYNNVVLCKLKFFSLYFFGDLSGWILVAVTFVRVTLVWFPQSGRKMCSRRCALLVIVILITALFGINGHVLYGMERNVIRGGNESIVYECDVTDAAGYGRFYYTIWPWIDLTVFSIGPFFLLLIGNSLIIGRLLYNWKKLQTQVAPLPVPTGQNQSAAQKKTSPMIALLFALNAVYVITTTPICIYNIFEKSWLDSKDVNERATASLILAICWMLVYVNNTFNFLLYFLSGTKFRKEAKSIFCSKCKQDDTAT